MSNQRQPTDPSPASTRVFVDGTGLALRGYDVVAYHTLGEATKGDPEITWQWNDATWAFATDEHRQLFRADPARYAPAFGGHCAVGKAFGFELPSSPKRWRIDAGRLFVNKNVVAHSQFRPLARRIRRLADAESP